MNVPDMLHHHDTVACYLWSQPPSNGQTPPKAHVIDQSHVPPDPVASTSVSSRSDLDAERLWCFIALVSSPPNPIQCDPPRVRQWQWSSCSICCSSAVHYAHLHTREQERPKSLSRSLVQLVHASYSYAATLKHKPTFFGKKLIDSGWENASQLTLLGCGNNI